MKLRFSTGAAAAFVAAAAWVGCGGDPSPLGGPYGGTGNNPTPSAENLPQGDDSGSGNSNSSGGNGSSGNGSSSSSGGTNPGGSSSSGTHPGGSSSGNGSTSSSSGAHSTSSSGSVGGSSSGNGTSTSSSGGSSSSSSSGGSTSGGPMTWSQIYSKYLASGTTGNCASGFCHGSIGTPSSCYTWLQQKSQINGTSTPALTNSRSSVVSWYGGNMPPGGPTASGAAQAVADMNAWAAAGGQNN